MRGRKRDRQKASDLVGRSKSSKCKSGESWKHRHDRRRDQAYKSRAYAKKWIFSHCRGSLRITNEGHHWTIAFEGHTVEWWPSSAKLVIDQDYNNGIHTHSWDQVERLIAEKFPKKEAQDES